MKNLTRLALILTFVLLAGGSKGDQTSNGSLQPPSAVKSNTPASGDAAAQPTFPVSTPVLQPILTVFQEGHTAQAVDLFIQANWSGRPIFPSKMALGLTDAQFKAIPEGERKLRTDEMLAQLDLMKQLATAVSNAGDEAAAKGDALRARQGYESLKRFGAALDDPKAQQLLRMVGQVSKRMAEHGLARLPK
jgi:hypothetical protein